MPKQKPDNTGEPARLPKGRRLYAIGDIHGTLGLLEDILARIEDDLTARPPKGSAGLVFLGDYIDRGPSSAAVMARLAKLDLGGVDLICLKGNHEEVLQRFLADPVAVWPMWSTCGGAETLRSYGIKPPARFTGQKTIRAASRKLAKAIPKAVTSWLKDLKLSHREGDYLFVHAGVRPDVALKKQNERDLLWIRDDFLTCDKSFGPTIVHGHTPRPEPVVNPNRIGIDTMAYSTGTLTCLVLQKDRRSIIQTGVKGHRPL
ncbi:hypothetical protein MNBD_ALPHA09-514 [hydrothermal vent metagenome]|uniref:Calcineurin-like phosphoesterase domain-containing protein n=1 Tax=hydrothermal vent metagenome TaxID=652676 RepID=A0A3B0TG23_9ZZZZ